MSPRITNQGNHPPRRPSPSRRIGREQVEFTATRGARRRGEIEEGGRVESRYLAEFLESQKSDLLRETNADRDHGRKEGNEGSAVVWSARHERCGRRAAGTPTPQSHHARRDGDATTPPPHGPPPTVRALRCRAGLGLPASVKRATWACPSRHRRGTGLYCLRAARRKPDKEFF